MHVLSCAGDLPRDVADGCDQEQVRGAREEVPQEGTHHSTPSLSFLYLHRRVGNALGRLYLITASHRR